MKESAQPRHKSLEVYKNVNKLTLAGSLGVAVLVPPLAAPALALAAVDGAQIYAINRINKKKEVQQSVRSSEQPKRSLLANPIDIFVANKKPQGRVA